jgi:hypothetical protein
MKLFMVYVGGGFRNANTELHDMRFSIGETIEACYDDLRRQWWGDPKSLHLDAWGAVEQADGFDVVLSHERADDNALRLFFVNLGGYRPNQFEELHRNVLVVATDAAAAKTRALRRIQGWAQPHRDKLFEVEKTIDIGLLTERTGYSIRLTKAPIERPFAFECRYVPIG